jgi:hypothetical protein
MVKIKGKDISVTGRGSTSASKTLKPSDFLGNRFTDGVDVSLIR